MTPAFLSGYFSDAYAVSDNTFVGLLGRWTTSVWMQVMERWDRFRCSTGGALGEYLLRERL